MTTRRPTADDCATVVDVLAWAADVHGGTEAYVEPSVGPGEVRRALSFAQWHADAGGVAGFLAARGVSKGDVVCLLLPSSIDYARCYAGALALGAVTAGINPRLGPSEIASIVHRTRPTATVWDRALGIELPPGAGQVVERDELASAAGFPPGRRVALHPADPVAVVFTSGTTGRPKGAVFDHANLKAVAAGTDVLSRAGDRRMSPLPFPHVGYMTRLWDEAAQGVTTVIAPSPWRAADALVIYQDERITVGQGVPTQWSLLLDLPDFDRADFSSLRVAGTGAARVPAELVAEMRRRLGVPVVVRYTSTETSLGTGTTLDDADSVVATTVGRPVAGVELRLTDEDGRPVPPGTVGRVRLRSGAAMRGYWTDAGDADTDVGGIIDTAATAEVVDGDGFVITADYGSLDEQGNLRLAGRANELYIRGGYNVFAPEVEAVLATHPALARVAVVSAPDPVLGEVGVAFVEPRAGLAADQLPDLAGLRALCAATLADYKAPDALVVLEALPLTSMMKIDKRALARPAAEAAAEAAARHPRPSRPPGVAPPAPSRAW